MSGSVITVGWVVSVVMSVLLSVGWLVLLVRAAPLRVSLAFTGSKLARDGNGPPGRQAGVQGRSRGRRTPTGRRRGPDASRRMRRSRSGRGRCASARQIGRAHV